jgi:hypothetical protein
VDDSTENLRRRRLLTLRHGRVSMLATLGSITAEIADRLRIFVSSSSGVRTAINPNNLGAIMVPAAGWMQLVAYDVSCELTRDQPPGTAEAAADRGLETQIPAILPDHRDKRRKLVADIANGRLTIMAVLGMFFQGRDDAVPLRGVPRYSCG